jgi:hypothetical protein
VTRTDHDQQGGGRGQGHAPGHRAGGEQGGRAGTAAGARHLAREVGEHDRGDPVYVSLPASGAELLLQVLAQRSETGSITWSPETTLRAWRYHLKEVRQIA